MLYHITFYLICIFIVSRDSIIHKIASFQLLDLRQVISRMLGMDVNSLAVPDYEIIARLEKLILANQANASTAIALDTALLDVSEGFRAGYEDASRSLTAVSGSRSRNAARRGNMSLRTRPRSASPGRRRDNRSY